MRRTYLVPQEGQCIEPPNVLVVGVPIGIAEFWVLRSGGTPFRQLAYEALPISCILLNLPNLVEIKVGRALVDRSPARQLYEDRDQGNALLRQRVDDLSPVLGVGLLGDDTAVLKSLEPIGQDISRYTLVRGEELLEVALPPEDHVTHDQQAPLVA